jgi:hypothetical protein
VKKYPRADCPACKRDTAVAPRSNRIWRHDPPERDPELRSCPGSYALHQPSPGEYGYAGDQQTIFEI